MFVDGSLIRHATYHSTGVNSPLAWLYSERNGGRAAVRRAKRALWRGADDIPHKAAAVDEERPFAAECPAAQLQLRRRHESPLARAIHGHERVAVDARRKIDLGDEAGRCEHSARCWNRRRLASPQTTFSAPFAPRTPHRIHVHSLAQPPRHQALPKQQWRRNGPSARNQRPTTRTLPEGQTRSLSFGRAIFPGSVLNTPPRPALA